MTEYQQFKRKGFYQGKEPIINNKQKLSLPSKIKGPIERDYFIRSQNVAKKPPKARQIPDFDKIRRWDIYKEGIKVQLGPKTLKNILSVKVPDINNPAILIEKNMSLGQILKNQNSIIASIRTILNRFRGQVQASSQQTSTDLYNLSVLIQGIIRNPQPINDADSPLISQAIATVSDEEEKSHGTPPPMYLNQIGINIPYVTHETWINKSDDIVKLVTDNYDHPSIPAQYNLTLERPVRGVQGRPVLLSQFIKYMNANDRAIFDYNRRLVFKDSAAHRSYIQKYGALISGSTPQKPARK